MTENDQQQDVSHPETYRQQSQTDSMFPENSNAKCSCGSAQKVEELIKVNHYWEQDYGTLMKESNMLKARLITTEQQKQLLEQENQKLRQRIMHLESAQTRQQQQQTETPATHTPIQRTPPPTYTVDDIEALKQQLLVYKEDFEQEKEDRSRLYNENSQLQLEVQKLKSIRDKLLKTNETIKENYRRVDTEKEHIIHELRRLSGGNSPTILGQATTTNNSSKHPPSKRLPATATAAAKPFVPTLSTQYTLLRSPSQQTLRSEDVLAHSAQRSPPFFGGHVERD